MSDLFRTLRRAMTVADLVRELQELDPCARVVFAYTSYWEAQVALPVISADEATVTWSEHHRLPRPCKPDDEPRPTDCADCVVLNLHVGEQA